MINFDKAINFPFAQKDWQKTVGVFFLILLALSVIAGVVSGMFKVPASILDELAKEPSNGNLKHLADSTYVLSAFASFVVSIVTLPVSLYLSGYLFNTSRNILFGVDEPIRPHGEIMTRIKFGTVRLIINLVLGIVALIALAIPGITLVAGIIALRSTSGLGIILLLFALLFFIAWLAFSFFALSFAQYSMEYLYLTKGLREIFNISKVMELVKKNWKQYMILVAIEMIGAFAVAMTVFSCCFQFIAQPILQTIVSFILAYSFGMVYKQIYSEEKESKN